MRAVLAAVLFAAPAVAQAPASSELPRAFACAASAIPNAFADMRGAAPFEDEDYPAVESEDADVAPRGFGLVSPGLCRSAQPKRGNLRWLADYGVKTILDLRDPVSAKLERWEAGKVGIEVKSVPMSGISAPSFEQVDRALEVLTDPALPRPLLVHCLHGEDRTGLVVAAYRAAIEGVDPATAAAEAQGLGCCHTVTSDLQGFLVRYLRHRAQFKHRLRARP
jgi:protein-tyrosine phosphatase